LLSLLSERHRYNFNRFGILYSFAYLCIFGVGDILAFQYTTRPKGEIVTKRYNEDEKSKVVESG